MTYDERLEIKPHIYRWKGKWCVAYKPMCNWHLVMQAICWRDNRRWQ